MHGCDLLDAPFLARWACRSAAFRCTLRVLPIVVTVALFGSLWLGNGIHEVMRPTWVHERLQSISRTSTGPWDPDGEDGLPPTPSIGIFRTGAVLTTVLSLFSALSRLALLQQAVAVGGRSQRSRCCCARSAARRRLLRASSVCTYGTAVGLLGVAIVTTYMQNDWHDVFSAVAFFFLPLSQAFETCALPLELLPSRRAATALFGWNVVWIASTVLNIGLYTFNVYPPNQWLAAMSGLAFYWSSAAGLITWTVLVAEKSERAQANDGSRSRTEATELAEAKPSDASLPEATVAMEVAVASKGERRSSRGRNCWSACSWWSAASAASLLSVFCVVSALSLGSIMSVGSVGSVLSIGSVGSFLSVGSVRSVLSVGCTSGSFMCIASCSLVISGFTDNCAPGYKCVWNATDTPLGWGRECVLDLDSS